MPQHNAIEDRFNRIDDAILKIKARSGIGADNNLIALHGYIRELRSDYESAIRGTEKHSEEIRELQEKIDRLTLPPLLHAVLIGRSPQAEGTFIVSIGGQRQDVKVEPSAQIDMAALVDGMEVLVTQENHIIVGIVGQGCRGESAEVQDVLKEPSGNRKDRLLVRSGSSEGMVVDMAQQLLVLPDSSQFKESVRPKAGDLVLIDRTAKMAFEKLPANETRTLELEKDPEDTYTDIAGLDGKIQLIKDTIELPYLYRDRFQSYHLERPHGILLHGPPGCGKTMIGRAVANGLKTRIAEQLDALIARLKKLGNLETADRTQEWESIRNDTPADVDLLQDPEKAIEQLEAKKKEVHSYFLSIKGPELLSKWIGESEQRIRQLFAEARLKASYTTPVVLFFDEIEAMFHRRGSGVSSDVEKTMVPQLLTELDGIEQLKDVVVIGASNRHELLDPALLRPGRLDVKIKIDRPDRLAGAAIFRQYIDPHKPPKVPLSWTGLSQASFGVFRTELVQIVERLRDEESFLSIHANASDPILSRLKPILSDNRIQEVVDEILSSGKPKMRDAGTPISYAEIAEAIARVCLSNKAQLVAEQQLREATQSVRVVLPLDRIGGVTEIRLPIRHLAGADGSRDAGTGSEHLVALFTDLAIDTLFSPYSCLNARVLAACSSEHSFLLREFVSGAILSNIVTRAKRMALRRETEHPAEEDKGIRGEDVLNGIRDEYEENKEQFVANKPDIAQRICPTCKRRHNSAEEYDIRVVLGRSVRDRWHQPRNLPYERGRTIEAAPATSGGTQ